MALEIAVAAVARQGPGVSIVGLHEDRYVRLVAPAPDGILLGVNLNFRYPVQPRVYDRIRVEAPWLDNRPGQPENRIVNDTPWQLLERPCCRVQFPVSPAETLFGDTEASVRWCDTSIQCIEADSIRVQYRERPHPKARILFRHQGHCYDLPLLDLHWREAVLRRGPGEYSLAGIGCRAPHGLRLITGLGEPWKGWRYKTVLGIIPLRGRAEASQLGPAVQ